MKFDFKVIPDLHLPHVPGFQLPNVPDLPSGKSIIRFVTDKVFTNTKANSNVVIQEGESKNYRSLTPGEIEMCKKIFKDSIDYSKVKIINKSFSPNQKVPMSPRGNAHYPNGLTGSDIYQKDFSSPQFSENPIRQNGSDFRIKSKLTFIHEMTHVWQFQKGMSVLTRGAALQSLEWTLPDSIFDAYDYNLNENSVFKKFNPEQQANIVADYYGVIEGFNQINFSLAWKNHTTNNSRYINTVMQPILNDPKGYELVSNSKMSPAFSLIFLMH